MRLRRIHVVLVLALATACASATKRYEQGQELEQRGRPAEAAQRYIAALRKDPLLADARTHLQDVGNTAVAEFIRQADAYAQTSADMNAADALRSADALIRDAAGVGVTLSVPADYADRHDMFFSRAVDQAISRARAAASRGDFSEAVDLVGRARDRWNPPSGRQYELDRTLYDTQMSWAEHEMQSSRFKSAYEHADAAAGVPGFDGRDANRLREVALRRGTVVVAVFPAVAKNAVDARSLPELNETLAIDHWTRPPRWVAVVNPLEAQRLLRQRNLTNRELRDNDVSGLARQLDARLGVSITLDSVRFSESKVERRRVAAKTKSGADTAYTVEDGQFEAWARANWREVRAEGGLAEHDDVIGRASIHFHRAVYAGAWTDLDLKPADRPQFDARDLRGNQELNRQLAHDLSEGLGRDIFDAVLRRVQ